MTAERKKSKAGCPKISEQRSSHHFSMADKVLALHLAISSMPSGKHKRAELIWAKMAVTAAGQQTSHTRIYHTAGCNKFKNKIASLPCAKKCALKIEMAAIQDKGQWPSPRYGVPIHAIPERQGV